MNCRLKLSKKLEADQGLYVCEVCHESLRLPLRVGSTLRRRCPAVRPTLMEKGANFGRAMVRSVQQGIRKVSPAEREKRAAACVSCLRFYDHTTESCKHPGCGCGVGNGSVKLWMQSEKCPVGRWHRPQWVTTEQRIKDTRMLMRMLPINTSAIIGVARSGLAPATEIAMMLHLPLYVLDQEGRTIREAGHGWRLTEARPLTGPWVAVDDSFASGRSKAMGMEIIANSPITRGKEIKWAVVYTNPESSQQPDYAAVSCHAWHLFEWNFSNSGYVKESAWDIDGAIFTEGPEKAGLPLLLPRRGKVPLIVTGRLESQRQGTEDQLRNAGIVWDRLEMFPGSLADRDQPMAISRHKANHYLSSECKWFVESCPIQAREIAGLTGKVVICPTTAEVF